MYIFIVNNPYILVLIRIHCMASGVFGRTEPVFSFLWTYLRNHKRALWLVIPLSSLSILFRILIPVLIGDSVNRVVSGNVAGVVNISVIIVIISAVAAVVQYAVSYGSMYLSHTLAREARSDLYRSMLNKNFTFFDSSGSGDLLSRMTMDVEAVRRLVSVGLSQFLTTTFMIVVAGAILFSLGFYYFLVFVALIPTLLLVSAYQQKLQRPFWRSLRKRYGFMGDHLQENLTAHRVIRSFNAEKRENSKFTGITGKYFSDYESISSIRGFYTPLLSLIVSLGAAFIIYEAGIQVINSSWNIGNLVASINIYSMLLFPVTFLGRIGAFIENARSGVERIGGVENDSRADYASTGSSNEKPEKNSISYHNVSLVRGRQQVIRNISMEIREGETVGIVGRTGSGKSSLVDMIPRFYLPTEGRVYVGGADTSTIDLSYLRKFVALVPQDVVIFSGSIRENVTLGDPEITDDDVVSALKTASIYDFVEDQEYGLDTKVGERGITLSGGQRQRVAIARAIASRPRVLILDDATSSLDAETESNIIESLKDAVDGLTTITISHRLSTMKLADRIFVIEGGELIQSGPLYELSGSEGAFSKMFLGATAVND